MWAYFGYKEGVKGGDEGNEKNIEGDIDRVGEKFRERERDIERDRERDRERYRDRDDFEEYKIKTYTHHGGAPPQQYPPTQDYMRSNYNPYVQPMQQMVYIDPSQYNPSKNNITQGISSDEEDDYRTREETLEFNTHIKNYEPDEINSKDLYLKTYKIEDISNITSFIDVIPMFPKTLNIDSDIEFMELRSWFYNTTDLLNIWHIHKRKSKLDYANAMKYLSFKLKEIVLYYYDYRVDFNDVNDGIQRGDKNIGDKDGKHIKKKLFNFKNSAEDHIQLLLDNYPTRFYREMPKDQREFYSNKKRCCLFNKITFNEIDSIKYSVDQMQLTEEQYNIFRNEYLSKLRYLERRKMKFKRLFCCSNSALQVGSVILPTLIAIKDNINVHDIPDLKKTMDYSAILLSVIMGIITNLTIFFKVNQRYSLYTQYDNKLKQEMRRFITYTEKYNDIEVKDTHCLFPQFSVAIENYIEELSNQEYDYIVGNKEKDVNAFARKDEIYNKSTVNREIVISDKPKKRRDRDRERERVVYPPPPQTPIPKKIAPDEKSTDDDDDKISEEQVFEGDTPLTEGDSVKDEIK